MRLNPYNSLFGRIFLWFWLAMLLIIVSTIWIAKQLPVETTFKPAKRFELGLLKNASKRITASTEKSNSTIPTEEIISKATRRLRVGIVLLNPDNNDMLVVGKEPPLPDKQHFVDLASQENPLVIDSAHWHFVGPDKIILNNQRYLLFVGKASPPNFIRDARRHYPGVLIMLAIVTSGLLCLLLSWSFVKPLRRLKQAAVKMGQGQLSTRTGETHYRADEIGQLGKEFDNMAERLESMISGQKRMLADISHELRSPLARLQVAIGIAKQNNDTEQPQLDRIELESTRIEAMLAELLHLSALNSQQAPLELPCMELAEVLPALIEDIEFEAQALGKNLIVAKIPAEITVKANPELFNRALENVLRNAIKYAKNHIHLTINEIDENQLVIEISDDGVGVAEADINNIFTAFYRTTSARDRDSGGVGLGLAIAAKAIENMHGQINAYNNKKGGLSVRIQLPTE
ncbi:ATP-binding protein [Alteromonadaceae bacterium BrNp21-10]|nr:ATP-binding protein [Alteromonadaceae bacterium BrNp21-10]